MAKMKLKTNRGAAKRVKVSGTGKLMRRKGWKSHLLSVKDSARKRRLTGALEVDKNNRAAFRRMLPYGGK